jgi:Putative lumazine-binding
MPSPAEIAAVRAVVDAYTVASNTADPVACAATFHPKGVMNGFLGDTLLVGGPEPFYDALKQGGPSPAYTSETTSITVTGRIATATMVEDGLLGANFVTHLQLLKSEGEWRIIAKLFTTI